MMRGMKLLNGTKEDFKMTYKRLLKISIRHTHDAVVRPHYIIKHMTPCECFHLHNNTILGWKDKASMDAILETERNYHIILH